MFKTIWRYFRAMLYTLKGDLSKWSEAWESNTSYIKAEYEDIKADQIKRCNDTTDAVAGLMELKAQKEVRLEQLTKDITSLRNKKAGAKAKADKQVQTLRAQGAGVEQIKADVTIVKCMDFYENFTSTLAAKEEEAETVGAEIEKHDGNLSRYKVQLQKMHAELKKIDQEKHETVADMEIAKAEQTVNNQLLGLAQGGTDERRQRIQDLRRKNRARADIKAEMAGVATEDVEAEFEQFAATTEAQSEFFDLIGVEEEPTTAAPEASPGVKGYAAG